MERVNESSCIPKRYKVYYDRKEEVIMRKNYFGICFTQTKRTVGTGWRGF